VLDFPYLQTKKGKKKRGKRGVLRHGGPDIAKPSKGERGKSQKKKKKIKGEERENRGKGKKADKCLPRPFVPNASKKEKKKKKKKKKPPPLPFLSAFFGQEKKEGEDGKRAGRKNALCDGLFFRKGEKKKKRGAEGRKGKGLCLHRLPSLPHTTGKKRKKKKKNRGGKNSRRDRSFPP